MSIQRWDPWGEMMSLREAMDQLLRESFVRPAQLLGQQVGTSGTAMGMPIDIQETDDAFLIRATMPGVRPDDVSIQIKGDTLQISGTLHEEHEEEREAEGRVRWLMRERRAGRFERTITLPATVKAEQAEATLEHGILSLRIPKAEEARARSIPVRTGGSAQAIDTQARERSG